MGLRHIFVTNGQKRDYLSRASQRARGVTKNMYQVNYVDHRVDTAYTSSGFIIVQ